MNALRIRGLAYDDRNASKIGEREMRLAVATLRTSVLGIAALAILIVLPAWSLNYWQGWVFIAVFAIATNLIGGQSLCGRACRPRRTERSARAGSTKPPPNTPRRCRRTLDSA